MLATGVILWWMAATIITGDPLFILHNWPETWHQDMYGHGNLFSYGQRASEIIGLFLVVPFLLGLWGTIRIGRWIPVTTSVLLLFVLHTLFRAYGLFGEAGYPRYMVSVAPAIAVLTLHGWNTIASLMAVCPRIVAAALGTTVLSTSLAANFCYLDSFTAARDPIAIGEMSDWLRAHPVPFKRLIWSNARMCIVSGLTLVQSPSLRTTNRESTLAVLREAPSATLVFWDDHFGPNWFGLAASEIEENGYQRLRTRRYSLPGVLAWDAGRNREIEVSLLLKP
jgi:hypothetical protein